MEEREEEEEVEEEEEERGEEVEEEDDESNLKLVFSLLCFSGKYKRRQLSSHPCSCSLR